MSDGKAEPLTSVVAPPASEMDSWRFVFVVIGVLLMIGLRSVDEPSELTLQKENRMADRWPALSDIHWRTLGDTAKAVTSAFDDRYAFRDQLNYLRHFVKLKLFNANPERTLVIGKEGHLFYGVEAEIQRRYVTPETTLAQAKNLAQAITRRYDFLHGLNKRYYVMIAPDKASMLSALLPAYLVDHQPSRYDLALSMLRPDVRASVLDIRPILRGRADYYYKTDSHWTPAGTQAVYTYLRGFLAQHEQVNPGPAILPKARVVADSGGIAVQSGVADFFPEPIYHDTTNGRFEGFDNCYFEALKISKTRSLRLVGGECKGTSRTRLMVCRDSFFSEMLSSISSMFQSSLISWSSIWNVKKMLAYNPDVLLDEVVERDVPNMAEEGLSGESL